MAQDVEEVDIIVAADTGLKSLGTIQCSAFSVPGSFMYPENAYIGLASPGVISSSPAYLGVYNAVTKNLITSSNTVEVLDYDEENACYPFLYVLDTTLRVTNPESDPGFIFAFFKNTPPTKYRNISDNIRVTLSLRVGATISSATDCAWTSPVVVNTIDKVRLRSEGSVAIKGDGVGYSLSSGLKFERNNSNSYVVPQTVPWVPLGLSSEPDIQGKNAYAYVQSKSASDWARYYTWPEGEYKDYEISSDGELRTYYDPRYATPHMAFQNNAPLCGYPGILVGSFSYRNNPRAAVPTDIKDGGEGAQRGCFMYEYGESSVMLVVEYGFGPNSLNHTTKLTPGEAVRLVLSDTDIYPSGQWPFYGGVQAGVGLYALGNKNAYLTFDTVYGDKRLPIPPNIRLLPHNYKEYGEAVGGSYWGVQRQVAFGGGVNPKLSSLTLLKHILNGDTSFSFGLGASALSDVGMAMSINKLSRGFELAYASTELDPQGCFSPACLYKVHSLNISPINNLGEVVDETFSGVYGLIPTVDSSNRNLTLKFTGTSESSLDIYLDKDIWTDVEFSGNATLLGSTQEEWDSAVAMPYVFTRQSSGDAGDLPAFDSIGQYPVLGIPTDVFLGNYINIDAGQPLAVFNDSAAETFSSTNGGAVAVNQISEETAWSQLIAKKYRNLYTGQGWAELLSFPMPANWVWDDCSIKPEGGVYKLCGRVVNGCLEWQFGNLVEGSAPSDAGDVYRLQWNAGVKKWESVVVTSSGEIVDSASAAGYDDMRTSYTSMLADAVSASATAFTEPMLRWAGDTVSKANMLDGNGKLKVSCEPIYLGMFNVSGSYLAKSVIETLPSQPGCEETCSASEDTFYKALTEVSPVWFLFASIRDGLINLVAIEHKIDEGEPLGIGTSDSSVTNPYELYGDKPIFNGKRVTADVPPGSYGKFNIWKYTNLLTPEELYVTYREAPPAEGYPAGWYYSWPEDGQNGDNGVYYPIPDSIMEAKCYRVPCPRWMEWHSVIDDTSYPINIALCQFNRNSSTGSIEVVTFNNKSLSNRGFIDNTLSREYRWQKYGNTWSYASYADSEYVASLSDSSFTGTVVTGTAYLPLGFRHSKSYAGYANQTLAMTVGGKCVRFEQQEIARQGGVSPYIEQNTYYIVNMESPVYSSAAFAQLDKASSFVSVDNLALPTGSLFVYDTLPDFNLEQFTVPADDIGDGTIMVRKEASYEFENKNIIIIEGESSVGTVSEFTFGVGILHGPSDPGTVYMGPVPGGLHSSYTGTLVLQYEFRLGVTYDPMYNSSLKSFSRIVMDNARMTIRNAETDLNNIEVLGGEVGILKMDSVSSTSIVLDLPEPSDLKWIPGSAVNSGATGSAIGNGVLTAEGIANLVSEIGRDNPGVEVIPNVYDLSGWFAGTGQDHSFDAYGEDITIPANGAYGINSFSFKSRPALSGEYVVLGVSLKGQASRIVLKFSTDNRLGYSLWQYNASTAEATCLIENTYVAGAREVEAVYDDDPVAASQLFVVWTANNPNGAAQGNTVIFVSDIEISYTNASSVGASEYATLDVASVYLEPSSEVDIVEEAVPTKFALESSARASVTINKLYGVGDLYIQNQTSRTKYYINNSSGDENNATVSLNGTVYISTNCPTAVLGLPDADGAATPVNFDSLVVCQGGLLGGVGSNDLEKSYVKAVSATLCNGAVVGQSARLLSDKLHAGSGVTLRGTVTADNFTSYGSISVTNGCHLNVTNTFLIGGTISIPSNTSTRVSINSAVLDLPCSDIPFEDLTSYDSLTLDSGASVTLTNVKDSSVINYTGAEGQGSFKYIIKNDNSSSDVLSIEELSCSNSSVNIYKTANGSYLFKDDYIIPDADNSSVTCISAANSVGDLDTYAVATLGEEDMYVSPEDWMHPDGEEEVSEYYLEKFESVDNAVEVERSTITCCDPFPEDCCDLWPGPLPQGCTGCGGPVIIDPEDPNEEEEEEEGGGGGGGGGGEGGGGGGTEPVPQYYADVYYCQSSSGSGIAIQAKKKPGLVVAAKGAGSQAPTVQIVLPDGVSMEYIVSYLPTTISNMTCEARGSLHFSTTPSSAAYNYPYGGECKAGAMLYGVNPQLNGAVPLGANSNVGFTIPVVYKSAHRDGAAPQAEADVPFWLTSIKLSQLQVAWDGPVTTFTSNVKPVLSGTNTFLKYKVVNTVNKRYRVLQGWLNLTFNYLEFEKASGFDEAVKRSLGAGMSFNGSVSCSGSIEGDNGTGGGDCSVNPAIGPTVTASQGGSAVVVTPTVSKGRALAKAPRLVNAVSVQPVKMEINGVLEGGSSWDYCCSDSATGRATPTLSGRIYANLKITN